MDNGIQSNGFRGGGGGCAARTQQRAEIHGVVVWVRVLRSEENTQVCMLGLYCAHMGRRGP